MSYTAARQTRNWSANRIKCRAFDRALDVIRGILLFACTGVLIGIPVALIGAHLVSALEDAHVLSMVLYHVNCFDPGSVGRALSFQVFVTAVTGYLPERCASRVEPMIAFREEWLEFIACFRQL
jgi:hypothetical protein